MVIFLKRAFYSICDYVLNAIIFITFGVIVAFAILAFSPVVERSNKSSLDLEIFLNSSDKSKAFSFEELNKGVSGLIFSCASQKGNVVTSPPMFGLNGDYLEVGVPVSVNASKLWVFVLLSFDGDDVEVHSARVGLARLPKFIAEKVSKSLYSFYSSDSSLKKYIDIIDDLEIEVSPDGVVIKK